MLRRQYRAEIEHRVTEGRVRAGRLTGDEGALLRPEAVGFHQLYDGVKKLRRSFPSDGRRWHVFFRPKPGGGLVALPKQRYKLFDPLCPGQLILFPVPFRPSGAASAVDPGFIPAVIRAVLQHGPANVQKQPFACPVTRNRNAGAHKAAALIAFSNQIQQPFRFRPGQRGIL